MNIQTSPAPEEFDRAAAFASALSLWNACHQYAKHSQRNLSEMFNGIDQLMRLVVDIGSRFEKWSCQHIDFNELTDVWPYLLEDKFGKTCIDVVPPELLDSFGSRDCLRVSMRLRLPIIPDGTFPVPVDVAGTNPTPESPFCAFRIQTVRNSTESRTVSAYTWDDDPFDQTFGKPYFGLYGVCEDRTVEHIADRGTYSDAVSLAKKLAPGIDFSAP